MAGSSFIYTINQVAGMIGEGQAPFRSENLTGTTPRWYIRERRRWLAETQPSSTAIPLEKGILKFAKMDALSHGADDGDRPPWLYFG